MLEAVLRILSRCGTHEGSLPPTALYNEGWMLRLLLDHLVRHRHVQHPLSPHRDARWASEVFCLLGSCQGGGATLTPNRSRMPTALWAHGDLHLRDGATQLVVIEATMGSGLSIGTKNARTFDQAARNVACMARCGNGAACTKVCMTTGTRKGSPLSSMQSCLTCFRGRTQLTCCPLHQRLRTSETSTQNACASIWPLGHLNETLFTAVALSLRATGVCAQWVTITEKLAVGYFGIWLTSVAITGRAAGRCAGAGELCSATLALSSCARAPSRRM
jgi:hypothetical protein